MINIIPCSSNYTTIKSRIECHDLYCNLTQCVSADSFSNAAFCLLRKYSSGSSKSPDMTRSLFCGCISSVDTANGTMDAKSDRDRPSFIRSSLYLRYAV